MNQSLNGCIITGCELRHGDRCAWGDLFMIGEAWVFNAILDDDGQTMWQNVPPAAAWSGRRALLVKGIPRDEVYFERRGVIVIQRQHGELNPDAQAYLQRAANHG